MRVVASASGKSTRHPSGHWGRLCDLDRRLVLGHTSQGWRLQSDSLNTSLGTSRWEVKGVRVLIVGGGIGGMAAAIALRSAGHEPLVFERAEEVGDVGAGIVLGRSAMRVLASLGVADDVRRAGNAITAFDAR